MRRFSSFREFYPFYLTEHAHPFSRRLHFVGSLGVLGFLVAAIVTRDALADRRAAVRLRLRMGRALHLREEPAGHLQAPALVADGRLGDVQGHSSRAGKALTRAPMRRNRIAYFAAFSSAFARFQ